MPQTVSRIAPVTTFEPLAPSMEGKELPHLHEVIQGSMPSGEKSFTATAPDIDVKPILPPATSIFRICDAMARLGVESDEDYFRMTMSSLKENQAELEVLHKERLAEIEKTAAAEKKAKRWGLLSKVMTWIASFAAIITGVALIMTGVGAVAGGLILGGGVLSLGNQIMQMTDGWNKIADLLPCESDEKKRTVVMWMQIGISLLSLVMGIAGGFAGGFKTVFESLSHFNNVLGAVSLLGGGICTIGEGVSHYHHRRHLADNIDIRRRIKECTFKKDDLHDTAEKVTYRLSKHYEDFSKTLQLQTEVTEAIIGMGGA